MLLTKWVFESMWFFVSVLCYYSSVHSVVVCFHDILAAENSQKSHTEFRITDCLIVPPSEVKHRAATRHAQTLSSYSHHLRSDGFWVLPWAHRGGGGGSGEGAIDSLKNWWHFVTFPGVSSIMYVQLVHTSNVLILLTKKTTHYYLGK